MARLRSIQVLRGAAAAAIVVHHSQGAAVGAAGVDLFFVISGFIMATVAAGRRPAEFLFDRAWRIYPLWFIALLPWLFLKHHSIGMIVSSATLWPFYGVYPILHVGWSLTFEVLFYAGFALALATRAWVPLAIFASCLPFCDAANVFVWQAGSPIIIEFLAGVGIAHCRANHRLGAALLMIAAIWLVIVPVDRSEIVGGSGAFLRLIYWGVPAAMIVYGARSLERWFAHRAFDVAVFIGDASYAIYLFHVLLAELAPWPAGLALGLTVGVVGHLLIERPIMRARKMVGAWVLPLKNSHEPVAAPTTESLG